MIFTVIWTFILALIMGFCIGCIWECTSRKRHYHGKSFNSGDSQYIPEINQDILNLNHDISAQKYNESCPEDVQQIAEALKMESAIKNQDNEFLETVEHMMNNSSDISDK